MGGGTAPVSQTTTQTPSPQAQELLDLAMPSLRNFAANPPQVSPFSGVAPFDPSQTAGQEMALGAVGKQQQTADQASDANRFLLTSALYPETNPALDQTIRASTRPITQALTENELPAIRGTSALHGQFGGSRQGIAEGLATGRANTAIGDTAAKVATSGYQSGLDAMTKALGLAPQTTALQSVPAATTSAVGDVRQGLAQALLGEQTSKFNYNQLLPLLTGSQLAGVAGGIPGGTAASTGTTAQPNSTNAMIGAGGSVLAALLPTILSISDERAKDDIRLVGILFDNTPVYTYRLKGSEEVRMGLMAQDLESRCPEAVFEVNGVKMVDYARATQMAFELGGQHGARGR